MAQVSGHIDKGSLSSQDERIGDLLKRRWLLFVGPAKTGTSWVDRVLREFDGVSLPQKVKETFFFEKHFDKGVRWYLEQFPQDRSSDLMVEVAPTYFFSDDAPERIVATISGAKIVVTLREPVRRAVSHYLNLRKYGFTDLDIDRALEMFPNITRHSLYAPRLEGWFHRLGRSNVEVVFYEEVVGNVPKLVDDVLRPYEVKPKDEESASIREARVNAAAVPRSRMFGRLGQRVAKTLRGADLHLVIELGKRLGLKRALFAGGVQPNQRELEIALSPWREHFAEDRAALARLLGRSPPW
jgi:Sulfotransferase domain